MTARGVLLLSLCACLAMGVSACAAASAQHRNPVTIYPAPVTPKHALRTGGLCASTDQVSRPGTEFSRRAVAALAKMDGHRAHDRRYADRAYWPVLDHYDRSLRKLRQVNTIVVESASRSGFAEELRKDCGREIVERSVDVRATPRSPDYRGPARNYLMIERHGHWLLWFYAAA